VSTPTVRPDRLDVVPRRRAAVAHLRLGAGARRDPDRGFPGAGLGRPLVDEGMGNRVVPGRYPMYIT
jgi:hypothetical protein